MSWEREPLFTKSRLFFEKAYQEEKESPFFGLWCAMGLELLIRSAVAHVSPTLLADPDPSQQNLLHALNLGSAKSKKKSLITIQVITLCRTLITDFNEAHFKIVSAIINQRNEELHTGSSAFEEYPTQQWIAGFYESCKILSEFQGESLNSLFGEEVQAEAEVILAEVEGEVLSKTKDRIAAYKKVFEDKPEEDRLILKEDAKKNGDRLSTHGHHRVICPACESTAVVIGEPYGKEHIENREHDIIVKRSVLPTKFSCSACGLKLNGYNTLKAAGIANHYTRTIMYSPEEYYDMINPDDYETIVERYNELDSRYEEFNNE